MNPAPRRAAARLGGLALVAVALAGCLDVPVASVSPPIPPTPEPTPPSTTYTLGTAVWYEGLLITVEDATATLDERGGPVIVRLKLENPAQDDADLNSRVLLQVDAGSSDPPIAPTRESKIPTVPGGGTAEATLTYELQGIPSADNAVLLVGELPLHVARVPFTAAGGAALVYEPIDLSLSGAGAAGDLRITLRSAVTRWDLPDWSEELSAQLAVITVTYDVTYLGDFSGGFAFTGDNVALRLPAGNWIGARHDGHSQSIELIGAGKTAKGLSSRFEVPYGTTGRFALVVRNGSTSKVIPFRIPG
ncbi:MAG TPA: hypothetical protein VL749_03310 [Patescibacteria group bacterium]|nr:hypothetical protein [Patescibacteria group bacterium]